MTSPFIDPAAVASIKSKRMTAEDIHIPRGSAMTRGRMRTITPRETLQAFVKGNEYLIAVLDNARSYTDGREIAVPLVSAALDLQSYACDRFAGICADPKGDTRSMADRVLGQIWTAMQDTIKAALDEQFEIQVSEAKQELEQERQLVTAGIDAAQQESTTLRRQMDAMTRQHQQQRAEWEGERKRLNEALNKAQYDAGKAAKKHAEDLRDLPRLEALVSSLERQVADLKAERTALAEQFLARETELLNQLDKLSHPLEVAPMPTNPQNALERLSYSAYLRSTTGKSHAPNQMPLTPELVRGWRQAFVSEQAMLAQLRRVVGRMLG